MMARSCIPLILLLIQFSSLVQGIQWFLSDTYIGDSFFSGFTHEAIADPTHGRVQYVDEATAKSNNLSWASATKFRIRADWRAKLSPNGPGRKSVRLQSRKEWGVSTIVADITHMPRGCATWPAFWTNGPNWPNGGEIDIIEGVNDGGPNQSTLHTGPNCKQPPQGEGSAQYTGNQAQTNCDARANSNAGCGIHSADGTSYGPSFDAVGGGWYAMERRSDRISVWFWPRDSSDVPQDVKTGAAVIHTKAWGTPYAEFVSDQCDIPSHFAKHRIIINLSLCGDWAGSAYSSSGCPGTCVDYVNNNPSAFVVAYWEFNSVKVYTLTGSSFVQKIQDGLKAVQGILLKKILSPF
ncbi:endo-1,3(4)-beta-glucanase-like protein [Cantharellus anzutake]|uniref:endo-1,3(4)-beta-glucanase-like protein n=1 Tax=Cantharellus anzutake TaxID=1750568 RepID=UPI0019086F28|nr:endo-1,3(4)-beta-glucanase-like protein [Cantharellus anzutake]KAF8325784.1 endo-1,3(4)-beta-glucanase-like protein [Cantharellus anzutake]